MQKTEYLDGVHVLEDALMRAVEWLRAGEVVAFPTETVYGLGANVFDPRAIEKVFRAKERPADNPLICHVSRFEEFPQVCEAVCEEAQRLAEHFMPGPLTLVLPRNAKVCDAVTGGLSSVAVRVPDHPVARRLIERAGFPLVAPSANRSGRPSPTCAQHVLDDLDGRIAAVLDGGPCRVGIESTVLSLLERPFQILRPGAITRKQIEAVLGEEIGMLSGKVTEHVRVSSPGMKYRHYAPQAKVRMIENWNEALEWMAKKPNLQRWLLSNQRPPKLLKVERILPLEPDRLYRDFRDADRAGVEEILVMVDEEIRQQEGLLNRILKSAEV